MRVSPYNCGIRVVCSPNGLAATDKRCHISVESRDTCKNPIVFVRVSSFYRVVIIVYRPNRLDATEGLARRQIFRMSPGLTELWLYHFPPQMQKDDSRNEKQPMQIFLA